jgi:antitoxin component of MazEF toxin-antitoxin module
MSTVTLRKQGNSVGFTIPADVRARMGLEVGQDMLVIELNDGIKLVPRSTKLERQLRLAEQVLRENATISRELAKL